jgi:hypothetical protein
MSEPIPLRLRAGGSIVLPPESTEQDIDNAGRAPQSDQPPLSVADDAQPNSEEQL